MAGVRLDILGKDKSGPAFDSANNRVTGLKSKIAGLSSVLSPLKGLFIATFSVAAVKAIAESIDKIGKLHQALGLSTQFLSEMNQVANLSGASLETLAKGSVKLAKSIGDANDGLSTQVRALDKLGLSSQQLINLPLERQLETVADAISKMGNETLRTKVGMDLFGRSFVELAPLLLGGADAIKKGREEAEKFGLTLTETEVVAVEGMNDAIERLGNVFLGLGQRLVVNVAPAVEFLATALSEVLLATINGVRTGFRKLVEWFLKGIGKILEGISFLADKLSVLPGKMGEAFAAASDKLKGWAEILALVDSSTETAADSQAKLNRKLGEAPKLFDAAADAANRYKSTAGSSAPKKAAKSGEPAVLGESGVKIYDRTFGPEFEKKTEEITGKFTDFWDQALGDVEGRFQGFKGLAVKALDAVSTALFNSTMAGIFGGKSGAAGGGSIFGAIGTSLASAFGLSGALAAGGPAIAGNSYLVGEKGPEIFTPSRSGTVTPNGGMAPVVVNMNISTPDANSFRRSQGQVASEAAFAIARARRNM